MIKSIYFEILIDGFREKPFLIKSSLQGFEDALTEFEKTEKINFSEKFEKISRTYFSSAVSAN